MVTFKQFNKSVLRYKEQFDLWEERNNTFPRAYTTMIIEDEFVDKLLTDQDSFLEEFLGGELFGWIIWYFYDKPKGPYSVNCGDKEYMIDTIDDFLSYMKQEYFNVNL